MPILSGTAVYKNGSKGSKTTTVSTSWNFQKTVVANGEWEIALPDNARGSTITVYLNGKPTEKVTMKGDQFIELVIA